MLSQDNTQNAALRRQRLTLIRERHRMLVRKLHEEIEMEVGDAAEEADVAEVDYDFAVG